ncbi:MAG: Alpha/beta hydrolase [Myxococcales bacterium]|nr:Alpha/beta hydrolase [Myxococcales bacterium]
MNSITRLIILALSLLVSSCSVPSAMGAPGDIASRTAKIDGMTLHYLIAGQGDAVILLHGYTQTSDMWRPLIPVLAKSFTVIAPDLPGIGGSSIPDGGLDAKTAAIRIHALARSLQIRKTQVVGHDIGLMVAYAYAAQFPAEVSKLALLDAFLPGIGDWQRTYHDPRLWHFTFTGPTAEALVADRERIYFDHFWNDFAADRRRSLPEVDRERYTAAYARPGRMRAGWGYFASFEKTAKDFAQLAKTPLPMPVLVISGEKAAGPSLASQVALVAPNVTSLLIKDAGHWLLEERPTATMEALTGFLARDAVAAGQPLRLNDTF